MTIKGSEVWAHWRQRQRIEQYQENILMLGHSGYLAVKKKSLEVGITMPIVDSLYSVIFEGVGFDSIEKILGNDQPKDVEFLN